MQPVAGRYELTEEIGSGGMGAVWRGYDAVLDREVAVKVIRTGAVQAAGDAKEFAQRFQREARITARIRHHGVPQVYDAVLSDRFDRLYLVMEYIHGTGLRAYVDPARPLPIEWATSVVAQIATVLSHAHAVPVVHRDLKPENILVTGEGGVKVLDFGIAAILLPGIARLTWGRPIGTCRYMSPEQTRGSQVTPQSDLYALGCLLHELLCGRPVFDSEDPEELMDLHRHAPPIPLRALRADVPEELETLVLDLLEKRADRRPRDAYSTYLRLLPFLPEPGSVAPQSRAGLDGRPDPTQMFRRPNAPLTPQVESPVAVNATSIDPASPVETRLREAIAEVQERVKALLRDDRFIQAADALETVILAASAELGATHPRVCALRKRRAAILFVGGDYRRSLPEFDALAVVYERTDGRTGKNTIDCRRHAAACRAELGQATTALKQYRSLLALVSADDSDVSELAVELRRTIGALLAAEGDTGAARAALTALRDDLSLLHGKNSPEVVEIEDLLGLLAP